MADFQKQNASGCGGVQVTELAGGVTVIPKVAFNCCDEHITKLRNEIAAEGLALRDTSGQTQCDTLLRVLQHRGAKGINTPEGVGLGYLRIATRVQELEERGWRIASYRERIIGADGLAHNGIARYCLLGRAVEAATPAQTAFDLGGL